jgi:hypothetical protein
MLRVDEARDRRCGGFQTQDFSEGAAAGAGEPDAQDEAQAAGGQACGLTDSGKQLSRHSRECPFFRRI